MASTQNKAKVAYLFGPVSGRLEEAKLDFHRAEVELALRGYEVWNPMTRANNPVAEAEARELGAQAAGQPGWQAVMRVCLRDALAADELWGVGNWDTSRGAMLELFAATVVGTPAYDLADNERIEPTFGLYDAFGCVFAI